MPTLLQMMQITGSSLSLGLSDSTYVVLGRVVSLASFALMLARGMFAKWFYRKSAAEHIRRIRKKLAAAGAEPDPVETVWGMGYRWRA